MGKYKSKQKQKQSKKSCDSYGLIKLNQLNHLKNLKGGVRLQTILENVGDSSSVAFSFDLMSHYLNDSIGVDAVLNPNNFTGEISLMKNKVGSRKSELRVFSLTNQDLRWKTGLASKLRMMIGKRGGKGVINYDKIQIESLNLVNGLYSFIVSKVSENPSVRPESYKLTQMNDSREESYKIRKFYRTLKRKYNDYQKTELDPRATPERSHSEQDIADDTLLDTTNDDLDVRLVFDTERMMLIITAPVNITMEVDYIYVINGILPYSYELVILDTDGNTYDIGHGQLDNPQLLYFFAFMVNHYMKLDQPMLVNTDNPSKKDIYRHLLNGKGPCGNYYVFDKEDVFNFSSNNGVFDKQQLGADLPRQSSICVNNFDEVNCLTVENGHDDDYYYQFLMDEINRLNPQILTDGNAGSTPKDYEKNIGTFILQTINVPSVNKWTPYTFLLSKNITEKRPCGSINILITKDYIYKNAIFEEAHHSADECVKSLMTEIYSRYDSNFVFVRISTVFDEVCDNFAHLQGGKRVTRKYHSKRKRKNSKKTRKFSKTKRSRNKRKSRKLKN